MKETHRTPSSEEDRYRSLFENVPIGLYITAPDGRIIDANVALARMLGYADKAALLGTPASDLYANPADREYEQSLFNDGPLVENYEVQLKCCDGRLIWVRDTCRAILNEDGTIRAFEGSLQDITDEKAAEEQLVYMAMHDPLTGVHNRYALTQLLEAETSRAQRYEHPIGVLMIDVNRFKEVNDRFGHALGDRILQIVADVLCSSVRDTDFVVRYGGDEFLVVLIETNGETKVVRDRIIQAMADRHPLDLHIDFSITLSIGLAHWIPGSGMSMESVLSQADNAMYEEKRRGSSELSGRDS